MDLNTYLKNLEQKCNTLRSLYHLLYEEPTIYNGSWLYYLAKRGHCADINKRFPLPDSLYENYDNVDFEDMPLYRWQKIMDHTNSLLEKYDFIDIDSPDFLDHLAELEYDDKIPPDVYEWFFHWFYRTWDKEDTFRYQPKFKFATSVACDGPLKKWERCKLLDDLALLDQHCLENGVLGHGDLMNREFEIIDSFLSKKAEQISVIDKTYSSYLTASKAQFLDPSKVRLYKSPLSEILR